VNGPDPRSRTGHSSRSCPASCRWAAGRWVMSWRALRIRRAAVSGWSPNSCAIRPTQPRMPNCCTARLIAMATMSAVETSDGCSPEQNRASQRASSIVVWVTAICVAVGISHHPVLLVSRLWAAGRRSQPGYDRFSRLRAAGQMIMAGRARRDWRTRCRRSCSAARSSASASMNCALIRSVPAASASGAAPALLARLVATNSRSSCREGALASVTAQRDCPVGACCRVGISRRGAGWE
jgi:hypothetical protein